MKAPRRPGAQVISITPPEPPDVLFSRFEEYLSTRGVTPDQAIDNGLTPAFDSDERAQKIATVRQHAQARKEQGLPPLPGILIEYTPSYHTFRYLCDEHDYPTQDVNKRDGKPVKIASPAGRGSLPFQPRCVHWDKLPKGTRVYVAESALKALALSLAGFPAIGLNGVYTWSKDKALHPELVALFAQHEWLPVIVFDANAHPGPRFNPKVAKAQSALARALYDECGVEVVHVLRLPYHGRRDQGVDDYLGRAEVMSVAIAELAGMVYAVEPDGSPSMRVLGSDAFSRQDFQAAIPIIDNLIDRGESALLVSAPKCGKTRVALMMALSVANGGVNLFGCPDLRCHAARVLLVALEDKPGELHRNLERFAAAAGLRYPHPNLLLVTEDDYPDGSFIETKLDQALKQYPDLSLVILDNHTKLELLAGRPEPDGTLVQREYVKTKRYTDWCRKTNVASLVLFHAKKGSGSTSTIADKTNSTATAAGAMDNMIALDFKKVEVEADKLLRRFTTQMRTHRSTDIMLSFDADGVTYSGEPWEYDTTEKQMAYVITIYELGGENITAKRIAEKLNKPSSTVTNAIQPLIARGWVDSLPGPTGGYSLTPRALKVVGRKY